MVTPSGVGEKVDGLYVRYFRHECDFRVGVVNGRVGRKVSKKSPTEEVSALSRHHDYYGEVGAQGIGIIQNEKFYSETCFYWTKRPISLALRPFHLRNRFRCTGPHSSPEDRGISFESSSSCTRGLSHL